MNKPGSGKIQKICGGKMHSRTRTFGAEVHKSNIRVTRWRNKHKILNYIERQLLFKLDIRYISGALACGGGCVGCVSKSTHPRKFGSHVTVHRPLSARSSAPQGNQCSLSQFLASLGAQED